jgi:predicted Rossmann fold flavoprotein
MSNIFDVVVVGGGASGLMFSSLLKDKKAALIEHNNKLGAKILISGGGKCNITNEFINEKYFLGDSSFIKSVLRSFDQNVTLRYFHQRGLKTIKIKNNQYFCENSAKDFLDILVNECKKHTILLEEELLDISKVDNIFYIKTSKRELSAKNVVVASGGLSYASIGASDIGYKIAKKFGHNIIKTAPALVGLTLQKEQFFFKELSGISCDVSIKVGEHICKGSLLFAHKGVSGPVVLDTSLYWEKGEISIDFLPNTKLEDFRNSNKNISSVLPISKRLATAFLSHLNLDDKKVAALSKSEFEKLKNIKNYRFAPAGTFGYNKAEVTKGGVDTSELNPKRMMSIKCQGLYFIGEILDVTGQLGGYNIQWALSSAFVAANSINKE